MNHSLGYKCIVQYKLPKAVSNSTVQSSAAFIQKKCAGVLTFLVWHICPCRVHELFCKFFARLPQPRTAIGSRCASLVSSEAEAGPNVGARRALFRETSVFPLWAWDRLPGSWYGSGSGCMMNKACFAEDSGVLKTSCSSPSSSITFLLGLRVSSGSSSS